jgi:hypothetical protein
VPWTLLPFVDPAGPGAELDSGVAHVAPPLAVHPAAVSSTAAAGADFGTVRTRSGLNQRSEDALHIGPVGVQGMEITQFAPRTVQARPVVRAAGNRENCLAVDGDGQNRSACILRRGGKVCKRIAYQSFIKAVIGTPWYS